MSAVDGLRITRAIVHAFSAVMFACICLAGCGRTNNSALSAVLRYPLAIEPSTFDPSQVNEGGTGDLLQNIYEGLVAYGPDNRIVPALAEHWEVSRDGRIYVFHLRNARFHNGRPLNASDVKYSLERAVWPATKSSSAPNYLAGISGLSDVTRGKSRDLVGVQVENASTVKITLDKPRGYFLSALAYPTGWVVCREAIERNGGVLDDRAAIGTGPFRLKVYRVHGKAALERNDEYWGGRPKLAGIERPVVLDPSTRHLMYENGEIDLTAISASDFLRDRDDPKLRGQLSASPAPSVVYLCLHPKLRKAFADPRIRKAFSLALDKDELVRVASHGLYARADSLLPSGMPGADPNVPRSAFDPMAARKLFEQAGFQGGRGFAPLTLVYTQNQPERSAMAQLIRSQLQQNLGISISLQEREAALFVKDRREEKMDFYIGVWDMDYLDPQNIISTLLRTGAPLNNFGFSNQEVDSLVDRADSEPNQDKRLALYRQADRIAFEQCVLIPLVFPSTRMLTKPYVKDIPRNLLGMLPHTTTRMEGR